MWNVSYNLKLDGLAIDFNGSDFLNNEVSVFVWQNGFELTKSTPMVGMKLSVNTSS